MRGKSATQATMLAAVTPDALVPQGHPIRRIKPMVDSALASLSPTFSRMYASVGRPSIPPEHLLKGCLQMALKADVSREFFTEIVDQARGRGLLSDEHFSVDGNLLDAWVSMKSFRPS